MDYCCDFRQYFACYLVALIYQFADRLFSLFCLHCFQKESLPHFKIKTTKISLIIKFLYKQITFLFTGGGGMCFLSVKVCFYDCPFVDVRFLLNPSCGFKNKKTRFTDACFPCTSFLIRYNKHLIVSDIPFWDKRISVYYANIICSINIDVLLDTTK